MWKCFRQVKYTEGCLKLPLQGLRIIIKKSQLPSGVGILLSLDIIVLEILRILWSSLKRGYCLLEFLLSASFTAIYFRSNMLVTQDYTLALDMYIHFTNWNCWELWTLASVPADLLYGFMSCCWKIVTKAKPRSLWWTWTELQGHLNSLTVHRAVYFCFFCWTSALLFCGFSV